MRHTRQQNGKYNKYCNRNIGYGEKCNKCVNSTSGDKKENEGKAMFEIMAGKVPKLMEDINQILKRF